MKRLYIIRHAKSSWKYLTLRDFDRPLNKRGKKDAPFMASILEEKKIKPDFIISSPAKRAKKTAQIFAKTLNYKDEIYCQNGLYEASLRTFEQIVTSIDNRYETVFVFGHNPTLNMFISKYVDIYDNLPTCGVVAIEFPSTSWGDLLQSDGELLMFDFPKAYKKYEI